MKWVSTLLHSLSARPIDFFNPLTLLMVFLAFSGLINTWRVGEANPGIDFYHFWLIPQIVTNGESPDPYLPNERSV